MCWEMDEGGFFNIIPNVTWKSSWNGFLFLCFISVRMLYVFFLALFVKLLNRGELQMVGNISVSLLVHDRRGGRGGGELETMEVLKCCRLMRRMLYHPGFILSLTLILLMWRIG